MVKRKSSKQSKILNIFQRLSNSRNHLTKMSNNLPAKLVHLNNYSGEGNGNVIKKSVSSTYTQVMHDGHMHVKGKQVINDSTKPFVLINEMENGDVQHYMMPRNKNMNNQNNNIMISGIGIKSKKTKKTKSKKTKKSKSKKNMKKYEK